MALKKARFTLDRSSLPTQNPDLGIRFVRQSVEKFKAGNADMVLLRPAGSLLSGEDAVGPEPRFNHVVCGMQLRSRDGTVAEGSGQLIISGQRFLGLIDSGTVTGGPPLDVNTSGNVFCFTFLRSDVYAPEIKKRRMKPSDFTFRSKEELPEGFTCTVFSAMASIANGKTSLWYDKNMLQAISEEGRQSLLRE